jgi:ubiquinone/menaquinone biosynthesis C-methylase UbiE
MDDVRTLTREEARRFYDRFGAKQDKQGWYEDAAIAALEARAKFEQASSVVEFGCGTGRLAAELLEKKLPAECRYLALDQSETMCGLAKARLEKFSARAQVRQSDGAPSIPLPDGAADRVVTTYVLDLLSIADIAAFQADARRVLRAGGLLCAVGLTPGERGMSRAVTALWSRIHRKNPAKVGGCRPLRLADHLPAALWKIEHREVVSAWGIASEVVIASAS